MVHMYDTIDSELERVSGASSDQIAPIIWHENVYSPLKEINVKTVQI